MRAEELLEDGCLFSARQDPSAPQKRTDQSPGTALVHSRTDSKSLQNGFSMEYADISTGQGSSPRGRNTFYPRGKNQIRNVLSTC